MHSPETSRSWPPDLLHPVLDSLVRPHGMGFFIFGARGTGKTAFLADMRNALSAAGKGHAYPSPALRWSRVKLGDRRYLQCAISLSQWAEFPHLPLQGILAAELSRAIPELSLPLSSAFFTRGEFTDALAARGCEGLVIMADDLDKLLVPAARPCYMDDLAFLEELGGMISVYLLPIWLLFTLTRPLPVTESREQVGGRLRNRYTSLYLQRSRLSSGF